jgi:hypothetical protein
VMLPAMVMWMWQGYGLSSRQKGLAFGLNRSNQIFERMIFSERPPAAMVMTMDVRFSGAFCRRFLGGLGRSYTEE